MKTIYKTLLGLVPALALLGMSTGTAYAVPITLALSFEGVKVSIDLDKDITVLQAASRVEITALPTSITNVAFADISGLNYALNTVPTIRNQFAYNSATGVLGFVNFNAVIGPTRLFLLKSSNSLINHGLFSASGSLPIQTVATNSYSVAAPPVPTTAVSSPAPLSLFAAGLVAFGVRRTWFKAK